MRGACPVGRGPRARLPSRNRERPPAPRLTAAPPVAINQADRSARASPAAATDAKENHRAQGDNDMAMKRRAESSFVLFDVTYADGTQTSNRKVPLSVLDDPAGEAAIKAAIAAQDRQIALASGRPRGEIKSVKRSRT